MHIGPPKILPEGERTPLLEAEHALGLFGVFIFE
jgi:hypothetical protein